MPLANPKYGLYVATLTHHPLAPVVLSNGVQALPHQLAALYGGFKGHDRCPSPFPHKVGGLLRAGFPVNSLIADETGLGKTVISGLFIFSLLLRGLARDVAIVAPKAVVGQWQDELFHKFGLYFKLIGDGDGFLDLMEDLKHDTGLRFIASVDLIKGRRGRDFVASLPGKRLDLAVIDEAHHVITRDDTLRSEVATELAEKSKSLMLMSATPFRGYYEAEYKRVSALLGNNFLYIRRFKDNAVRADGKPIFPKRVSYTVEIGLDPRSYQLYSKLKGFIESSPLSQLTKLVLLKRLSSSLYALYMTLSRLHSFEPEDPFLEETDDVSGVEPDMRGKRGDVRSPTGKLEAALDVLKANLGSEEITLKEQELIKLLRPLIKDAKVVVFTEYKATLDRLMGVLSRTGIVFRYVHGGMDIEERRRAVTTFWTDERVRVFLATDAAGEGINLQVAAYQVNYDIPWSPLKLEQRFGRIHRYGQEHTTQVYNMAVKGTLDDRILEVVMRKLDIAVKLLGDWVFDYIGTAIKPEELRKILLEGRDTITERSIIEAFSALKRETHDPGYDKGPLQEGLGALRRYVSEYLGVNRGIDVNVLELLRVSGSAIQDINNGVIKGLVDVPFAVYKVDHRIGSLVFLEREDKWFVNPLTKERIGVSELEQHITRYVEETGQFYGFKKGRVELYGI